jgi:hypothetical protein
MVTNTSSSTFPNCLMRCCCCCSAPLAESNYMYYQSLHINLSISSSLGGIAAAQLRALSMSEGQRGASSWILVIKMAVAAWLRRRQLDGDGETNELLLLVCTLCPRLDSVLSSNQSRLCTWTALAACVSLRRTHYLCLNRKNHQIHHSYQTDEG